MRGSRMQVGAILGNIDVSYTNAVNWTNREFLTMSGQPSTEAATLMSDRAPAENAISESSSQSVTTRLQAKKRVADTQPEDPDVEEGATAKPPDLLAPEHNSSAAQQKQGTPEIEMGKTIPPTVTRAE